MPGLGGGRSEETQQRNIRALTQTLNLEKGYTQTVQSFSE